MAPGDLHLLVPGTRHTGRLGRTVAPRGRRRRIRPSGRAAAGPVPAVRRGGADRPAGTRRGVHAILFGALAAALIYLDTHLGSLQSGAARLLQAIDASLSNTGQDPSRDFLSKELTKVLHLHSNTVVVLAGTAVAYSVVEAVEAVGLWKEQRWAEYLTAVATAGFLPFEIKALIDRETVFRVLTLVITVAC